MFRLIKLASYALLGYVFYELFQGLSAQTQHMSSEHEGRSAGSKQGGRQNMTGPGRGHRVHVEEESTGVSGSEYVGRGAV